MNNTPDTYDAIVIGCGPAGASCSTLLASRGRRVLVLEREKFPRYHIGESLIPYTYFPLERMGLIPKMKASHFPRKYSVQFVSSNGRVSEPFYFFKHLKHDASCTWQVLRSEFDQLLMDNARDHGVEVREQTTVRELLRDNGRVTGVRAVGLDGVTMDYHAPITVDATGRDAFVATRNGWKVRDPYLNKIALWTYYEGAVRDAGVDEGATTVAYVPEKGWFWYIPLPRNIVSVGIVAEKDYLYSDGRDPAAIFEREIGRNVWIQQHLAPGRQIEPFRTTGEYSYRSRYCAQDGLVLIGDAFAFLDPVFSSGVFLGLRSGEIAAGVIHECLTDNDVSAERFTGYAATMRQGIEAMRRLVYVFYDHNFSFGQVIRNHPGLVGDLTDCLIGNLLLDFDPLFDAIARFANVPAPLHHGTPLPATELSANP